MASPSQDLQRVVRALLIADATVAGFVGDRVYDGNPPQGAAYPRITFGATDFVPQQLQGCDARLEAMQIDVWSRQNGELYEAKAIVDAVEAVLNGATPDPDTHAVASCEVTLVRVFRDADRLTAHGVVQVEAMVERI